MEHERLKIRRVWYMWQGAHGEQPWLCMQGSCLHSFPPSKSIMMPSFSLENPRGAAKFIHVCLHFSSYMFTMCSYCCVHIAVFNMNAAICSYCCVLKQSSRLFSLSKCPLENQGICGLGASSKQTNCCQETSGTKKGKLLFMIFSIGKEQLLKLLFLLPQALLTSDVSYASRESKFLIVLLKS